MTASAAMAEDVAGRVADRVAAPVRVDAEVVETGVDGIYHRVVLAGDGLAAARPGQFVAVSVGGDDSPLVAARAFSIHEVSPGTVSLLVAVVGPGTAWLARRRVGDRVGVTGPLGRGFTIPGPDQGRDQGWVGVGGGYGTAPLAWAAREAARAGALTAVVAGAASADRLCAVAALRAEVGPRLWVTTNDGSDALVGRVTDALPAAVHAVGMQGRRVTVAACGPMAMLAAVSALVSGLAAAGADVVAEVAVEERMACGVGICMTCVLPVVGADGVTRMTRSCVAGPVMPASAVRWDALHRGGSAVPPDAVGAPRSVA